MDFQGKTVLVAGASGVLGAQITKLLSAKGANVLGTATSNDSAARIPAEASVRLLLDLESPESIQTLSTYLAENHQLDGIILATGRVGFGPVFTTHPAAAARLIQVNYLGPAQLVSSLHPNLKARGKSFIAAITGVVAERSFPGMAAYCASKQALAGWLESVAIEWRRDGISVTDARPGHTETGLGSRALFGDSPVFPQGLEPKMVASKIIEGIRNKAKIMASTDF